MAIFSEQIKLLLSADTKGVAAPMSRMAADAKKAETSFDRLAKSVGLSSQSLKSGLVGGAAALVGTQMVQFLQDSVTAFTDSAKAASDLANSTGSSVETVSRFTAAMKDAGVSSETAASLLTKFTTAAGGKKGAAVLEELNVGLVRGADGMVDYAATMVKTVDAISEIGDSSQRNAKLIALFGKQGAKAFQDLFNSGVKLSDAMRMIDKYRVTTADDVRSAMEYDEAMDGLAASVQKVQFAIGRGLAPAMSDIAGVAETFISAVAVIEPATVGALVAFAGLAKAMPILRAGLASVGGAFRELASGALSKMPIYYLRVGEATDIAAERAERNSKRLRAAGKIAAASVGLFAVEGAFSAVGEAQSTIASLEGQNKSLREQAQILQDTDSIWSSLLDTINFIPDAAEGGTSSMTRLTKEYLNQAKATLANAEATDEQKAAAQALLDVTGDLPPEQAAAALATEKGTEAMAAYTEAMSGAAGAVMRLEVETRTLKDLLADSGSSQQEIADATWDAAAAQGELNRIDKQAAVLVKNVADVTWDAVNAELALIDARFSARDTERGWTSALAEYRKVAADRKSTSDQIAEAEDKAAQAAIRNAEAMVAASGLTMESAEGQRLFIDTLKELEATKGIPPAVRESVRDLRIELEGAAIQAEKGISVAVNTLVDEQGRGAAKTYIDSLTDYEVKLLVATGGVDDKTVQDYLSKRYQSIIDAQVQLKFDGKFATQADVQAKIDNLFATGRTTEAIALKQKLDAIVTVTANTAPAQESLNGLTSPPPIEVTVSTPGLAAANDAINALPTEKSVEYRLGVSGYADTLGWIMSLDKDRDVVYRLSVSNWGTTAMLLNALDYDRDVVYRVSYATMNAPPSASPTPEQPSVEGGGAGRALRSVMQFSTGRYAVGDNGQTFAVQSGVLQPSEPQPGTQVIVNLDGRTIARYLEPAITRKRSA